MKSQKLSNKGKKRILQTNGGASWSHVDLNRRVDPQLLLPIVKKELREEPLSKFLERGIGRQKNAAYLDELRTKYLSIGPSKQAPYEPNCKTCKDGLLQNGAYCDCETGREKQKLDVYQAGEKERALRKLAESESRAKIAKEYLESETAYRKTLKTGAAKP